MKTRPNNRHLPRQLNRPSYEHERTGLWDNHCFIACIIASYDRQWFSGFLRLFPALSSTADGLSAIRVNLQEPRLQSLSPETPNLSTPSIFTNPHIAQGFNIQRERGATGRWTAWVVSEENSVQARLCCKELFCHSGKRARSRANVARMSALAQFLLHYKHKQSPTN